MGGVITASAEPAYYARKIKPATFDDKLTASGTLAYTKGQVHVLIGFFHTDTLNEWRTPISAEHRRDGAKFNRFALLPVMKHAGPGGEIWLDDHRWTLRFTPGSKAGRVSLIVNDVSVGLDVPEKDLAAGTVFDRFGIITTWIDGNRQRIYFDDLIYTCKQDQ